MSTETSVTYWLESKNGLSCIWTLKTLFNTVDVMKGMFYKEGNVLQKTQVQEKIDFNNSRGSQFNTNTCKISCFFF